MTNDAGNRGLRSPVFTFRGGPLAGETHAAANGDGAITRILVEMWSGPHWLVYHYLPIGNELFLHDVQFVDILAPKV